jgi:type 1 glutamine amidotransferase
MTRILLVTQGLFHPSLRARKLLRKALEELDGLSFHSVNSMESLPQDLDSYAAMVLYVHHRKISETALNRFDTWVKQGGGVLGIHTATASFKQQLHYSEMMGGRFVGHGRVERFEIQPLAASTVFRDIPAFSVKDELYIHELQPGITPHFVAQHGGQSVPVVWTHQHGAGRICVAVPGHLSRTIKNKDYQKVLQQGLLWVGGR